MTGRPRPQGRCQPRVGCDGGDDRHHSADTARAPFFFAHLPITTLAQKRFFQLFKNPMIFHFLNFDPIIIL